MSDKKLKMNKENLINELEQVREYMRIDLATIPNIHLDISCVEFLKSCGYKPRLNEKYFKNLRDKLAKKGLGLRPEITYLTPSPNGGDSPTIHYEIKWRFVPLFEREVKV